MRPTRLPIAEHVARTLVDSLDPLLANLATLAGMCRHAHWNVGGPQFQSRHALFDRLAKRAYTWADDIAERMVALGGWAEGDPRRLGSRSTLPPHGAPRTSDQIDALATQFANMAQQLRQVLGTVSEPVTHDLVLRVLSEVESEMYHLERHLEPAVLAARALSLPAQAEPPTEREAPETMPAMASA